MEFICMSSSVTVGMLPPQYRFSFHSGPRDGEIRCPACNGATHPQPLPLAVYVDAERTVSVDTICRYCRDCDLVTAYREDIDAGLAEHFLMNDPSSDPSSDPSIVGAPYLVLGTFDQAALSLRGGTPISLHETTNYLHDFKEVLVPAGDRACDAMAA